MTTRFFLARHGQTLWNKTQRFQGQLDSELTEQGKIQATNIAITLQNKNIDRIISSPLGRAVKTAAICQSHLDVPVDSHPDLAERNLGKWQGQNVESFSQDGSYHELLHQFTQLKPEGGESAIDCGSRVYQALESFTEKFQNQTLLVIFHGEALRCFLAKLGVHSDSNAYELFDNGCLFTLSYQQQGFQLENQQVCE